jgi:hypothetical protein
MRENGEHGQNIMTRIYEEGGGYKWLARESGGLREETDGMNIAVLQEARGCNIVLGKNMRSDLSYLSSTFCVPVITSTCSRAIV